MIGSALAFEDSDITVFQVLGDPAGRRTALPLHALDARERPGLSYNAAFAFEALACLAASARFSPAQPRAPSSTGRPGTRHRRRQRRPPGGGRLLGDPRLELIDRGRRGGALIAQAGQESFSGGKAACSTLSGSRSQAGMARAVLVLADPLLQRAAGSGPSGTARPWERKHAVSVASSSTARPSSAPAGRDDRGGDRGGSGGGGDDGEKSLHGSSGPRAADAPRDKDEHPWKTRRGRARGRETCGVSTVLLVEDDPEIVGLLADFLAVEGFAVVSAPDAARHRRARHPRDRLRRARRHAARRSASTSAAGSASTPTCRCCS